MLLSQAQSRLEDTGYVVSEKKEHLKVKIPGMFRSAKVRNNQTTKRLEITSQLMWDLTVNNMVLAWGLYSIAQSGSFYAIVLVTVAISGYVQSIVTEIRVSEMRRCLSSG